MAVTFTSAFYDGPNTEKQRAEGWIGATYGVRGSDDWKVTAVSGADRTVSIALGSGFGWGVTDSTAANDTIQLDAIASGSRWDLIAVRRDWQPAAGGPTLFVKVNGGASRALPSVGTSATAWNRRPGIVDDQPIALVRVTAGQTQPSEIIDLRCWAANGGVIAVDRLALDYLAIPGAQVHINGTDWLYAPDANGAFGWVESGHQSASYDPLNPNGFYFNSGVIEVSGRSRHVAISINRNSPGLTINDVWASFGVVIPAAARTSTTRQFYIPSLIYKNGVYQPCTVFVDMRTGEVKARIESGSITYSAAVSFDVNLVAVE